MGYQRTTGTSASLGDSVMAKVMSPLAPAREQAGASCAFRYYRLMCYYSPKKIIESSENLYPYLCKTCGYEFASGFRHTATTIALIRIAQTRQNL